jgi:hypothetical protein
MRPPVAYPQEYYETPVGCQQEKMLCIADTGSIRILPGLLIGSPARLPSFKPKPIRAASYYRQGRHRMNLPDAPIAHEGFFVTHFFTVRDQEKSKDFYVRASEHGACRDSGKDFYPDWVWSADVHDFAADRLARRWVGW